MFFYKFDLQKALAAILYVSKALKEAGVKADFHKVFKILYFADRNHLSIYGRPMIGDHYIAMKDGPVPSHIYDILKAVRGDSIYPVEDFNDYLEVHGNHYISPKKDPDMDVFSESDLEVINESIEENKHLSFKDLKKKSHDLAYKKATKDDKISYREMAKVAGATEDMISYMREISENERLFA